MTRNCEILLTKHKNTPYNLELLPLIEKTTYSFISNLTRIFPK